MTNPKARRLAAVVVGLLTASLALSGCLYMQIPQDGGASSKPSGEVTHIPAGLEKYYNQDLSWAGCEDVASKAYDCAMVEVPLDYENPDDRSIEIAVVRHVAPENEAIGSLITNPGGPGASGYDLVAQSLDWAFRKPLIDNFDIIGFDPRGVGRSTAVACLDGDAMDAYLYDIPSGKRDSDEWNADLDKKAEAFAKACEANSDGILPFITTQNSARDIDVLRGVLRDEQLYYLGFSYGTFLGATYADLFPETAGFLVLDGAMDPSVPSTDVGVIQMVGFENALRAYMESCLDGSDCPFTGTVDQGLGDINAMLKQADAKPLELADGRQLGGDNMTLGIISALYSEDNWPYLTQGFQGVLEGDGETMMFLADFYNGRDAPSQYADNSTEAFTAYNCVDYPDDSSDEAVAAAEKKIKAEAPTIADFTSGPDPCFYWSTPPTGTRDEIHAEGAAPIVVVGTTNDPATPYDWAVSLAEQLDSGVLVTREGEGHTGYNKGNSCVDQAVEDFLIKGTVPEDGLVCK